VNIVRPSVIKFFSHWLEAIIILVGAVLFCYLTVQAMGLILPLVYGLITIIFLILFFVALRRASVSVDANEKSGFVQVDERQITYFNLGQSWSISLNDLTSVVIETSIDKQTNRNIFWIIRDLFGSVIRIPNTVAGNKDLFDAVSSLNGVSFEQISLAMGSNGPATFTVWLKI